MNWRALAKANPCKHINTHTPAKGMAMLKSKTYTEETTEIWSPGKKVE